MLRVFVVVAFMISVALGFAPKLQKASVTSLAAKSKSVPFLEQPAALDGSMAGDVGFDPFGFTGQWLDVSGYLILTVCSRVGRAACRA